MAKRTQPIFYFCPKKFIMVSKLIFFLFIHTFSVTRIASRSWIVSGAASWVTARRLQSPIAASVTSFIPTR